MRLQLFYLAIFFFLLVSCGLAANKLPENPIPYKKGKKWGYVNSSGKLIIPAKFDSAQIFEKDYAFVVVNEKRGTIDKQGNFIIPPVHDIEYYQTFKEGLLPVKDAKTNLVGFMNDKGNWVIKPQFSKAFWFSEGVAPVWVENGKKWFFIDKQGKQLFKPLDFQERTTFAFGYAFPSIHRHDGYSRSEYGLINRHGRQLLPVQYERLVAHSPNFIEYGKRDRGGHISAFMDSTGKEILPMQYHSQNVEDGYAALRFKGKSGLVDSTGKVILPFKYQALKLLGNHMLAVFDSADQTRNARMAFKLMNLRTKEISPLIRLEGSPENFTGGLYRVNYFPMEEMMRRNEFQPFFAFMDQKGNIITKNFYRYAGNFSEGLALVIDEKSKIGFVDTTGNEVIKCQYDLDEMQGMDRFQEFKNGLALVSKNGNYFYIDQKGKEYFEK